MTRRWPELVSMCADISDALIEGQLSTPTRRGRRRGRSGERRANRKRRWASCARTCCGCTASTSTPARTRNGAEAWPAWPTTHPLLTLSPVFDDAEATAAAAREHGLDGVVAKRLDSPYRPGFVPGLGPVFIHRCVARADPRRRNVMAEKVQVSVAGRSLGLSNLDKVLYPDMGFTKGEVIDYYTRVADVLLPHLAGRALTVIRFPNGIEGHSFFEKNAPKSTPDWVRTVTLPGAGFDQEPGHDRLHRRRGAGHPGLAGQPGRAGNARAPVAGRRRRHGVAGGPTRRRPRPRAAGGTGRVRRGGADAA